MKATTSGIIGRFALLFTFACSYLWSGCTIPFSKGSKNHYIVIGFGIITTDKSTNYLSQVEVVNSRSLGMNLNSGGVQNFTLGYSSFLVTSVDPSANVMVEVQKTPFRRIQINTYTPLIPTNQ